MPTIRLAMMPASLAPALRRPSGGDNGDSSVVEACVAPDGDCQSDTTDAAGAYALMIRAARFTGLPK